MGTITIEQIVSADGYAAERDGGLGFFGAFDATDDDRTDHDQLAWLDSVDAILFGRTTYEMFAGYWPTADPTVEAVAGWINAAAKHVVSTTLDRAPWGDGEITIHRDGLEAAAALRAQYDSIVVWGSLTFADQLFANGLVDELRLRTVPVLIGDGRSFTPAALGQQRLTLQHSTSAPSGHVTTHYRLHP